MNLPAVGLVTTLLAGASLTFAAVPAGAVVCSTEQLTDTSAPVVNYEPAISGDGTRVVWASDGEFGSGGDNGDANVEMWLYDTDGGPLEDAAVQVSNTITGDASEAAISADGSTVAYRHAGSPVAGNSDGNNEIWRYDITGATTTQVTATTGGDNNDPALLDTGGTIVFTSNRNIGGLNPDLNEEVFAAITLAGTLVLTDTPGGESNGPALASSSGAVALTSTGNLDPNGDNADGNREIFFHSSGFFTQITDTASGDAGRPRTSASGNLIAFVASSDPVGGNADGSAELFVHNMNTGTTTQLTASTDADAETGLHSMTGSGTRIAFNSDADFTGGNPDGTTELFLHDTGAHTGTFQVTDLDPGAFANSEALDADGTTMAFRSNADFAGTNADGNIEIFLATCGADSPTFTDVPGGNVFYDPVQWMSAAGIAAGFPNGTFKPQDPVKRQQMANFLYNLAGQPAFTPPATPTFTDVPATNVFYDQIEWMAATGIAAGFPNGTFKPQDPVKRQQMANFLYNLAGQPAFTPPGSPTFGDVAPSNPFFAQIEWMAAEGIASGFPGGLFKPNDPVKRQQMANFLLNLVNGPGLNVPEP